MKQTRRNDKHCIITQWNLKLKKKREREKIEGQVFRVPVSMMLGMLPARI